LAAAIERELGSRVDLIEGRGGIFDVVADGKMLFSKKVEGRFPEPEEIVKALTSP
jgi:selT/selW/selH-like putative selenoprotein